MNEGVHAALIASGFVRDCGATFLWGAFGYLAWLVPEPLAGKWVTRLRAAARLAVGLVVIAIAVRLPLEAAMVGDGWHDALNRQVLAALLFETSLGRAWFIGCAAMFLLLLAVVVPTRRRATLLASSAGVVLLGLVFQGHAMMHEGWLGYIQQANDFMHVLSAGGWLGALVPLVLIMRAGEEDRQGRGVALRRFTRVGHVVVALVVLTGIANTFLIVGGWPVDWNSPYQVLLWIKILVALMMIGLALRNRYHLVPQLRTDPAGASSALRCAVTGQIFLGASAIALVSIFATLDPH